MMAAVIRLAVRESMYTNMPTVYKSLLLAQQLRDHLFMPIVRRCSSRSSIEDRQSCVPFP